VTITADAKSEVCGIGVLDELDLEIIFGFFDSMHTHEQLLSEVKLAMSSLGQTSVIYIDDHQLTCSVENVHLGNLARRKLGLSDVPADVCNRFSVKSDFGSAVMELLSEKFMIAKQEWSLTDALTEDLDQTFFSYFAQDRMVMHQVGAELSNSSLNRAISYRLRRK
ncbi:MAG: hypothetical protein P8M81_08580, partial [Litorivicinaceae bacterium]|nr:hypothetical protein [Litorivicinaceae bacterium]